MSRHDLKRQIPQRPGERVRAGESRNLEFQDGLLEPPRRPAGGDGGGPGGRLPGPHGRAGRPQFDTQGFVYALAHEDDVKLLRWRERYDQIPEDTKDPGLRKAKKALKKKMPKRRTNQQYWNETHFEKLKTAPASKLASRGPLPWRLLTYMLDATPEVAPIRSLVGKRLHEGNTKEADQKELDRMLMTLWTAGYVRLEPEPPKPQADDDQSPTVDPDGEPPSPYQAEFAHPTETLPRLLGFRGVNPLFGVFLANHMGIADRNERLQALEAILALPGPVARFVRVPKHHDMPPGPLATTRIDVELLRLGLVTLEQLGADEKEEDEQSDRRPAFYDEEPVWVLTLAEKLKLLFDYDFPGVSDVRITPAWAAGEILEFGGNFNNFITSKGLQKQEGIIFRHLLRLILLIAEFKAIVPYDTTEEEWHTDLDDVSQRLAETCRVVDPSSTDKAIEQAEAAEKVEM